MRSVAVVTLALLGACLLADLLLAHHDLHSTVPAEFFQVPPPVLSALDLSDRGRTYVYEYEILDAIWEYDFEGDPNIVEVYVGRLRKKVDQPFGRNAIETVRGVGYKFAD